MPVRWPVRVTFAVPRASRSPAGRRDGVVVSWVRRAMRALLRGVLWTLLFGLLFTIGPIVALRWIDPPTTMFILSDRVDSWTGEIAYPLRHRWVDYEQISDHVKLAVIAAEDQKFPDHYGFDVEAIVDAFEARERGGKQRGASTISQQVAKNLFLWSEASWLRKGIEAYLTVLIELSWSKQRILEVYLNVAEFGRGVFGVGAAAETFFDRSPKALTIEQSARLAAVLPSPKKWNAERPGRYVQRRTRLIQRHMRRLGGTAFLQRL